MGRQVAIGVQNFAQLREKDYFYIDKTSFIKEWWDSGDAVTLITRPRRFGKTLNMSMLECFFSNKYAGRGDLFEGLDVWEETRFRELQGMYPVVFLSFAGIKHTNFEETRRAINGLIADLYNDFAGMLQDGMFTEADRKRFSSVSDAMDDVAAAKSLNLLCKWIERFMGKKCIVLLDEYDTPMQEAYVHGYWDELVAYTRVLFNNTFKTNPYLERAVLTGITRVSRESIFSDFNNPNIVTTTSDDYADCFGFTEKEVFAAMDEQGIPAEEKEKVKFWYDGFTFGKEREIYNPWSIIMYLDKKRVGTYWANTSGNGLVSKLIREGDVGVKTEFEKLLVGECIEAKIDEQIAFDQLSGNKNALWSLLLASGYLKVVRSEFTDDGKYDYQLKLTNFEVKCMFESMIEGWFNQSRDFGEFVKAMLRGEEGIMNDYMNEIALNTFSFFDAGGKGGGRSHPERFYHGFVLGLIVDRAKDYMVKSNRESGYGRYDVMMEPKDEKGTAVIMEFKVLSERAGEESLEDTAENALRQIEEKHYDADLLQRGIPKERIYQYGFAFKGEKCLIKKG
ncbi:MAG: AAA family ATPase [Lachnospiraceae bacterium]|nr:AAA family ATPase [Lachnospiraceae bacterium]